MFMITPIPLLLNIKPIKSQGKLILTFLSWKTPVFLYKSACTNDGMQLFSRKWEEAKNKGWFFCSRLPHLPLTMKFSISCFSQGHVTRLVVTMSADPFSDSFLMTFDEAEPHCFCIFTEVITTACVWSKDPGCTS